MSDKQTVIHYQFENKDVYEQALMEEKVIKSMRSKFNLMDGKVAQKDRKSVV